MKKTTALIIIISVLGISGYGLFRLSKSRDYQLFGGLTSRINTDKKVVALTFDDAPSPHTSEVLKLLAKKHVKATFYVIGQSVEKYPVKTKTIVEHGHELGNHSYSHQRLVFKSGSFIGNEIKRTNRLIRASGYLGEVTFRPPFGKKLIGLPWYLYKNNIKTITWDVEPDTYYEGDAGRLAAYTLKNTKPGSIVLLHPFGDGAGAADRKALPKVIDGLRARGYSFVTVSQLLAMK